VRDEHLRKTAVKVAAAAHGGKGRQRQRNRKRKAADEETPAAGAAGAAGGGEAKPAGVRPAKRQTAADAKRRELRKARAAKA
jgi:hypothetical protein